MKKSDLKDGMIVEYKDGSFGLKLGAGIISNNEHLEIEDLEENLTTIDELDVIVRVYESVNVHFFSEINDKSKLKLIWERKKEIDWSKVPKWTKVRCKGEFGYYNAYHYEYIPNEIHCFGHTTRDEFTFGTDPVVDYLSKRDTYEIHPSVKIQEEWYKE